MLCRCSAATPRLPTAQELLRKEAQGIASTADAASRGVKLTQYVGYKAQCDEQTKAKRMRDHLIDVGLNAAEVQVGCEVRSGSSQLDVQYVDIASLASAGSGKLAAAQDGPPIGTALFTAAGSLTAHNCLFITVCYDPNCGISRVGMRH